MSTDAYRAATFNPWVGINWMVSGKSVSGSEVLAEDNRQLTVMDGRVVFGTQKYGTLAPPLSDVLPVWLPIKYSNYYKTV